MGKANLKILAEAWLQIIENYCADFQEPYPPTEVLKDILDWMPTAEGDSLIECEWFDKNFPPVTTPRPACGCPFARADVARASAGGAADGAHDPVAQALPTAYGRGQRTPRGRGDGGTTPRIGPSTFSHR